MQETRVWLLIQEDPRCRGAAKPAHRNYWSPHTLEPVIRSKRSLYNEKPAQHKEEWPPLATTRENPEQQWRPSTAKNTETNEFVIFFFFKEDYCKNPIEIRWYLRLGRWESGEMASVCTLCRVPRVCWSLNQKHTGERSIRDDSKCLAEGRLGRLYEEMIWRRNQVFCLDMLHLRWWLGIQVEMSSWA